MKFSKKLKTYTAPVIVIFMFVLVLCWFLNGVSNTEQASRRKQAEAVKKSVENGITLCYSMEGIYPSDIEYLRENYGINYNNEKYIVHYDCFASNVRPTVTVIEKE